VGLRTAGLFGVKQAASFVSHQAGGFNIDIGLRDGELHTLVLANGAAKHDAFFGVLRHLVNKPVAIANTFGCNQGTLGIQAIKNVAKAHAFLTNQVFGRNLKIIEEQLVGFVVDEVGN